MQFLNDSNHFSANLFIHEWMMDARATNLPLNYLGTVIRHSTSGVKESHPYPANSLQLFRFCGMTCEEPLS
jgi:hypothetical protein